MNYWGRSPASTFREGRWKLIRWHGREKNTEELFNLKNNIGEKNNLIHEYPEITKKIGTELDRWHNKVNAKFPTKNLLYKNL